MGEMTKALRQGHREQSFIDWGESIVYRQLASSSNNYQTGAKSPTWTSTTIAEAIEGAVTQKTVSDSGGKYRIGDKIFRIRYSDMPSGEVPPKTTSEIDFESKVYKVIGYAQSKGQQAFDVITRDNGAT